MHDQRARHDRDDGVYGRAGVQAYGMERLRALSGQVWSGTGHFKAKAC